MSVEYAQFLKARIFEVIALKARGTVCLANQLIPVDSIEWETPGNIRFNINEDNKPDTAHSAAEYRCIRKSLNEYILTYLMYSGIPFGNRREMFNYRVPYINDRLCGEISHIVRHLANIQAPDQFLQLKVKYYNQMLNFKHGDPEPLLIFSSLTCFIEEAKHLINKISSLDD
jgi:hypothetical protein